MSDPFDALISGYLDETLTAEQLAAFEAWINADPAHARRFADAMYFEERLEAELKYKGFTESGDADDAIVALPALTHRKFWGSLAALAACLALFAAFVFRWSADPLIEREANYASVVQVADAVWEKGHELSVGDRIASQMLRLEAGIVHIVFDSGVEVTLQGPAVFELKSVALTRIEAGLLTCTVPPGAEGFRVDTRTAQVVDLGTAFGIDQRTNGESEVLVFEGEVEIATNIHPVKHLLTEGKAVLLGTDGRISEMEFAAEPYEKLWPAASGIAGSSGGFRFAPQWPRRLRLGQSDTEIFVVPEGYAQTLEEPCRIDMIESGVVDSEIPAGARVRSFLLQFNPADPAERESIAASEKLSRIEGIITFERPILGLIVRDETLEKTDDLFSFRSGRVPQFKRGLELGNARQPDVISLSKDRLTLSLKLTVFERLSDHVRVIVDASLDAKDQ